MTNTYTKLMPNVFGIKTAETYNRGDVVEVTTKYGKVNEHIIYNLVKKTDDYNVYSSVRADGFNMQERAKQKAETRQDWASSADKKSDEYYHKSNKDSEFLSLGEPIKVGHHSEKRHRKMFEQANNNMGKSVEFMNKAEDHKSKAEYWERRTKDINLSMPESIEYYQFKLEEAKKTHKFYKDNPDKREHSFSLTYAKKDVNDLTKKVKNAVILWGER